MPIDLIRAPGHDRRRSLGWLAVRWIEALCIHGPGDVVGRRMHLAFPDAIPLSNELVELLVDSYALDASGRRLYDSVFYSRPKGANKSGLAAWIACFEALGPARFDGFAEGGEVYEFLGFRYVYEKGEPMGRPVTYPFLRVMATEEKQASNVYDALQYNLEHGPLRMAFDRAGDIGNQRVILPDGGEIRADTASSAAKDGGRETWVCFDETHLYYTQQLIQMYETVTRNLAKRDAAQPWSFEPTTMYEPGRGSIAELAHEEAREIMVGTAKASRLLFNHRYAALDTNQDDDVSFEAGLRDAYGDAADYMDIRGIIDRRRSKRASPAYTAQFFLNQATQSGGKAIDITKWQANKREGVVIPHGSPITLGFDGSRTDDSTALKATDLRTGFQWTMGLWEKPENPKAADKWEVDEFDVDATVERAFRDYRVVRFYGDPSKWETAMSRWAGRYNHEEDESKAVVIKWPVQLHKRTAIAIKAYTNAIHDGDMTHDGNPRSEQHAANAYREVQNFRDDDGSPLWLVRKERPMSPRKIDDFYAGVLSWQARLDAIAAGALVEDGPSVYEERGLTIL